MCTGGEWSGVFQLRGITLDARHVHRARWESSALALSSVGKGLQRRAEAGLMDVGEETSLRAAIRLLCGRKTENGGRHDSAARIGTGVDPKKFVTSAKKNYLHEYDTLLPEETGMVSDPYPSCPP